MSWEWLDKINIEPKSHGNPVGILPVALAYNELEWVMRKGSEMHAFYWYCVLVG